KENRNLKQCRYATTQGVYSGFSVKLHLFHSQLLLVGSIFFSQLFQFGTQGFHPCTTEVTGIYQRRSQEPDKYCQQGNYNSHLAGEAAEEIKYRPYNVFVNRANECIHVAAQVNNFIHLGSCLLQDSVIIRTVINL